MRPERIELPTFAFEARRSDPLSYGRDECGDASGGLIRAFPGMAMTVLSLETSSARPIHASAKISQMTLSFASGACCANSTHSAACCLHSSAGLMSQSSRTRKASPESPSCPQAKLGEVSWIVKADFRRHEGRVALGSSHRHRKSRGGRLGGHVGSTDAAIERHDTFRPERKKAGQEGAPSERYERLIRAP